MKRRSFLAMLGLAPVAGSAAAVTVQDVVAEPNFRMHTVVGPGGYRAGIGFETRATGDGAYRSASLFIDEQQKWISEGVRDLIDDARVIASHI
jgi:hypothetical protein